MRLALAQLNPIIGDLEGNGDKILAISKQACKQKADVIITPELSLWGYPPQDLLLDPTRCNQQIEILNKIANLLAKENPRTVLLIGIAEQAPDLQVPKLFNSFALITNGSWKVVARKQLLPTYDVFDEKRYFRPASVPSVITITTAKEAWKVGITICEDLWVEEEIQAQRIKGPDPIEQLKGNNIDLLINLSASPFSESKELLRNKLAKKAVSRLGCPLIYLNQVGGNDELIFDGSSFVMSSKGEIILSLERCQESSKIWDTSQKATLQSNHYPNSQEKLFKALVLGVKDYCEKCGFRTALLGLSGGIDSALVAVIATAALKAPNITSILMPSPWSSPGSISDALALVEKLKINSKIVPINELMTSYDATLKNPLGELPKDVTAENLQSRIRGTLLMAIANQRNHLLLSTGNKSELAIGYCTLYGDMNGGLAVIGDLYKTSVFKLCEWLDSQASYECRQSMGLKPQGELIGLAIRSKPPSAELRKDQLDSDSLPEYEILDPILEDLIEGRLNHKELINKGYDKNLILQIQSLLKKAEFKRKQAPPLLKISNQAFGSGWRIPIASK